MPPELIVTLVAEDGIPHDQLESVFQSVLVAPVQVSKIQLTFKVPAFAVKFDKIVEAPEPVPPYVPFALETPPTVNALVAIANAFKFATDELPIANVPVTVSAAEKVTPPLLLMVRLFTDDGKPVPVICAELPL